MPESIMSMKRTRDIIKPILDTQFIGLTRVLLGLPIEHFFDRFKTQVQADQSRISLKELTSQIIHQRGVFKGVFAGFSSQMTIQVLKQYYRWPMMILIPKYIKEHLPSPMVEMFPIMHKALAGASIAVVESLITCPLERAKCALMTQENQQSFIKTLFQQEKSILNITRNLYTGLEIMMLKQLVSWTNYLYWDHFFRYLFKDSPHQALTLLECVSCSFLTAVPNILFVQPFDTIKTLYQMEKNQAYRSLNLLVACQKLYQEKGMLGFYAGWKIRMSQFIVQALLTTPVIDYLERRHGIPQI